MLYIAFLVISAYGNDCCETHYRKPEFVALKRPEDCVKFHPHIPVASILCPDIRGM